jgi:hypothetical protein
MLNSDDYDDVITNMVKRTTSNRSCFIVYQKGRISNHGSANSFRGRWSIDHILPTRIKIGGYDEEKKRRVIPATARREK